MNSLVNHLDLTSMPVVRFMIPDHCSGCGFVNWSFKDCLIHDLSDILTPSHASREHCLSQSYCMLCSMILWSTTSVILTLISYLTFFFFIFKDRFIICLLFDLWLKSLFFHFWCICGLVFLPSWQYFLFWLLFRVCYVLRQLKCHALIMGKFHGLR